MKKFFVVLLVFIVALLSGCVKEADYPYDTETPCNLGVNFSSYWEISEDIKVTSSEVHDGDTFYINDEGYRIIGIDTPEISKKVKFRADKPVGEFGEEATEYFKWFADEFSEKYIYKGKDKYDRNLIYLFSSDGSSVYFYEASVTAAGLARPLVYEENAEPELINAIIKAYRCAWENRRGIFSLWDSAPVLKNGDEWEDKIGKIVWIEDTIEDVGYDTYYKDYVAEGKYALFAARENGYKYMFGDFSLHSLKGKKVKVYGELWEYNGEIQEYKGRPEIMVRAPFEIVVIH
ncbi:MAG: thermonuclease family protein [Thermotogaceae bacterium]|nr:thermonuclease family protein [Thermotogaceae bacterium]